ncbi:transposase [Aneurinibacillus aneurinilyticus]|jgi:transposase-like protein|uniref:Transposase n=2 Tax=Aneurinibacillus aneurinilyticus TaxID=1391 RepID=A0A848CZ67_ANEAE|nr:transposase [Aneurinibacillus aneurinilyticus]ERI09721.1 hypothetical protein HMPREF0083_02235 [Aneurinibacillus aneurinilyticus ATCC 12856]MCI1695782.1 transposase [Aneurinibacillus aneurinilyticus]MED0672583.1 transposase [Aneurinibacillus aneurinilyticus]MED0708387.1 transposase [Aneurinibacillus aneurinilyticus]MED0722546.1 transposase [Aneurinibacillus aneurinilyticus]
MRRHYTSEFKQNVIKDALKTGVFAKVARKYALNAATVSRWVREYKQREA